MQGSDSDMHVARGVKRQCDEETSSQASSKRHNSVSAETELRQLTPTPSTACVKSSEESNARATAKTNDGHFPVLQRHVEEVQELEQTYQNEENALKKKQEECLQQILKKHDLQTLNSVEHVAHAHGNFIKWETALNMLRRNKVQRMEHLRVQQLKESFPQVLRITGKQKHFMYGCYELNTEDSTYVDPVYKMCQRYHEDLWLYMDASHRRWFIGQAASKDARKACGFARSAVAKQVGNPLEVEVWEKSHGRCWNACDMTIEELPEAGIEVVVVSLAGAEILRKSFSPFTKVEILKSELLKNKSPGTVELCFRNRKLNRHSSLGSIGFSRGEPLQAIFKKVTSTCSKCFKVFDVGKGIRRHLKRCVTCGKRYCKKCSEDLLWECFSCDESFCFGCHEPNHIGDEDWDGHVCDACADEDNFFDDFEDEESGMVSDAESDF